MKTKFIFFKENKYKYKDPTFKEGDIIVCKENRNLIFKVLHFDKPYYSLIKQNDLFIYHLEKVLVQSNFELADELLKKQFLSERKKLIKIYKERAEENWKGFSEFQKEFKKVFKDD
jgi:hypothetical protein